MKFLIILASIIAITIAQRPTYAGLSSKGYPELASRFRDPADDQDGNTVNNVAVGNRLGVDEEQPLQNLPTDARGDASLVTRLNQWPEENRPFWFVNSEHIERHRHPNTNVNQQQNLNAAQQGTQQRVNQIQSNLNKNRQEQTQEQQTSGNNLQPVLDSQPNGGRVQSRFGESVATETRTIKPLSQRGSFAGERN